LHIYPRQFVAMNFFNNIVVFKKLLDNEHFEFYIKNFLANDVITENSKYMQKLLDFAESVYSDLSEDYKFKIGVTNFLKEFHDGITDWAFAVIFTSELNPALYEHLEKGKLFISDTRIITDHMIQETSTLEKIKRKFADALMGIKKMKS